jgi:hypothetical protein
VKITPFIQNLKRSFPDGVRASVFPSRLVVAVDRSFPDELLNSVLFPLVVAVPHNFPVLLLNSVLIGLLLA